MDPGDYDTVEANASMAMLPAIPCRSTEGVVWLGEETISKKYLNYLDDICIDLG